MADTHDAPATAWYDAIDPEGDLFEQIDRLLPDPWPPARDFNAPVYDDKPIVMPLRLREKVAGLDIEDGRRIVQLWTTMDARKKGNCRNQEINHVALRELVAQREAEDHPTAALLREIVEEWIPVALTLTEKEKHDAVWVDPARARKYGVTVTEAMEILGEQGYACAICLNTFLSPRSAFMDHNHATGEFRGFLCPACNTGLGHLRDSPKVLAAALEYLMIHGHYGEGDSK